MNPAVTTLTGACVASAAVHAALAPAHVAQGSLLGIAFVAASAGLTALAAALGATRGGRLPVAAAVTLLATLVVGYGVESGQAGGPVHAHEHAGVDPVGPAAATKAVELIGIAAGLLALGAHRTFRPRPAAAAGGPERRP